MTAIQKNQSQIRIILASIIGNILEWYDFALFGLFATLIAQNFFPKEDARTALIGSFGVFAVGYFMRPLGGVILGHFGDKRSRRFSLIIGLLVMGVATTLIGVLPTYANVGIWATVLLVLFRIVQGLAVGGEFPGSFVILFERSAPRHRAFSSSLALSGAGLGVLLGSGLSSVLTSFLTHAQMEVWGWRLPFLFGVVLAGIGLYIRTRIWRKEQSNITNPVKIPLAQLLQNHKRDLLKAFFMLTLGAVITGMLGMFLVTYLTHYLHFSLAFAFKLVFVSMLIMVIAFPISALIADYCRVYKRWLLVGLLLLIIATYPLFMLMQHGAAACTIAVVVLALLYNLSFGPFSPVMMNLFPQSIRYSGIGIAHGLAFSIIAGTSPLVLNAFVLKWGVLAPSYYVIAAAVVTLIAVACSKEERDT